MNSATILDALHLPNSARVDQRVPKKLLLENGAPTTSDKRLITDAIEEIQWIAALKPNTIGVPHYHDAQREYLEIAVMAVTLRGPITPTRRSRLAELIHRAVPYPVFLLQDDRQTLSLSLAHKRWAQNEVGKVVLDGDTLIALIPAESVNTALPDTMKGTTKVEHAFLQSLPIERQPQATLLALYQGWTECVQALHAARRTGNYQTASTREQAAVRHQALADCERLEAEIQRLRSQAAKEKQLSRQVELNLTLKRIQAELIAAQQQL